MATSIEIEDKKAELAALKVAYLDSIASGGITKFEQGSTKLEKVTTMQLKSMKENAENQLFIMENA